MDTIAEIKSRMSITGLISKLGLEMNAAGFVPSIYKVKDKVPSMMIYPDQNRYWCYATSNGGDVINLYQDYYKLDAATARKELAQMCGVDVETENVKREQPVEKSFSEQIGDLNRERELLFKCFSKHEKYVYDEFRGKSEFDTENEAHRAALREVIKTRLHTNQEIFKDLYNYCQQYKSKEIFHYLTEVRKLPIETLDKFKTFTINNVFQVRNHLKKKFEMGDLKRSGLFNKKGNFIFYNHRLIIPYLFKNEPIYLRGRYFDQQNNYSSEGFKYLGLVNDALDLNRTKRFFNNDIVRDLFTGERLYITEGEFDAMAIDAMNRNAIAVPGAGNLPGDKYFIPLLHLEVSLCMDSDEAGNLLKDRLLQIFSGYNKYPGIKKIPTKDANEFLMSA